MIVGKIGPKTSPGMTTEPIATPRRRQNTTAVHTPIHIADNTRTRVASPPFGNGKAVTSREPVNTNQKTDNSLGRPNNTAYGRKDTRFAPSVKCRWVCSTPCCDMLSPLCLTTFAEKRFFHSYLNRI